jgi:hypothetical protein
MNDGYNGMIDGYNGDFNGFTNSPIYIHGSNGINMLYNNNVSIEATLLS